MKTASGVAEVPVESRKGSLCAIYYSGPVKIEL